MQEKIIRLTYTPQEAESILRADYWEKNPPQGWTAEQSDGACRDAQQFVADTNSAQAFLLTRARLILARMRKLSRQEPPLLELPSPKTYALLVGILALVGFVCGMLTDRLANPGAAINLLAAPLLTVFAWNALISLLCLLSLCGLPTVPFSMPRILAKAFLSLSRTASGKTSARMPSSPGISSALALRLHWQSLFLPSYIWKIRSALHFAAAAFGLGLIVSCLVRGIGTAYTAGWESTWFSGKPQTIADILHFLYGWLPDHLSGLQPFPDIQSLAAMDLTLGHGAPGAAWLARLIWLTVFLIVLPRLVLAAASSLRALREQNRLVLSYPAHTLEALQHPSISHASKTLLIWCCQKPKEFLPAPNQTAMDADLWDETNAAAFDSTQLAAFEHIFIVMDPAGTPENEVHGSFIKALLKKAPQAQLLLDFSHFDQRFANAPERQASRRALWENFAAQCQIPLCIHAGQTLAAVSNQNGSNRQ